MPQTVLRRLWARRNGQSGFQTGLRRPVRSRYSWRYVRLGLDRRRFRRTFVRRSSAGQLWHFPVHALLQRTFPLIVPQAVDVSIWARPTGGTAGPRSDGMWFRASMVVLVRGELFGNPAGYPRGMSVEPTECRATTTPETRAGLRRQHAPRVLLRSQAVGCTSPRDRCGRSSPS